MTDMVACLKFVHTDEERDWMCRCGHEAGDHGCTPSTTGGACLTCPAPDLVIPRAAIVATTEASHAHGDASGPYGAVKCRCGQSFPTGVEQLQHASQSILQAAIPHLRGPLVTAPGIPDSLVDVGVAGIGTMETQIPSLSTFQAQAVARAVLTAALPHLRPLVEAQELRIATQVALKLGRQEAAEEIAVAIEATRVPSTEDNSWLLHAAKIARDTGKGDSA